MKISKSIAIAAALAASAGHGAAAAAKCLERPTNLDFEQGGLGWKLGSGAWSIDEKGGRNGSKCLAWDSAKASPSVSYTTQRFRVEGGCRYRFGGWIRCEGLAQDGKPAQARMTVGWYNAEGRGISQEDAFPVAENSVGNDGWVRFEGLTPPLLGRASMGQFAFTQPSKGVTGRFLVDDLNIEQVGSVPVEWLASTAYRDWAEDGEVGFHASLHVNVVKTPLETLEAVLVYTDASGRRAERRADAFGEEAASATLRVSDLARGAHPVSLEVRRKSGGLLGSASLTFTRAPLPRRRVAFDSAGRTLVDGKRFFPVGTYASLSPASLAMVTNSPFNCLCSYGAPTVAQLDALAASGRLFCYNLSRSKSVIDRASLDRTVVSVKGHPALLAWYVFDEVPQSAVPGLRDMIRRLYELDPDHPAWGVTDKPHFIRAFLGTCDVLGMDPYPIGNRAGGGRNAIGIASDWPLQARAESFGTMPQWQVPQTFNWKWYRKGETSPEFRFPTKAELESMTYQAIAAGANGLFNFSVYAGAKDDRGREFAANWGNVCDVAAGVKSRADLLLSDPGPAVEEIPRHTVVRTWRTDGGDVHALVCNKTRGRVAGTVRVKGCEAVKVDLPAIGYSFVRLRKASAKAAPAAKTALVNLDFEQGEKGWGVDRKIWKIVKGEGRNGSAALVYENSDTNAPYVFPIQRVPVEGGGVYKFGAWVKVERLDYWGKPDKPSIYFDWSTAEGKWLGAAYARPVVNNLPNTDGWEYYEGVSRVLPAGASLGKIAAVVSRGRVGRVRVDDFSFSPLGTKVVEFVATSRYRDEGWDGTVDFHVLQHVNTVKHPLSGLKAAFVVVGADGRERRLAPSLFTPEEAGVSIPCSELAMGAHPVRYEILTPGGKVLGGATCSFTRLAGDPKRRCYFDAHRRLLVDGKKFFPLGLYYYVAPVRADTPDFRRYLSGPFNAIMPYTSLSPEHLAEIGRTGLKVIYPVTGLVRGSVGQRKGCETKEGADRILSERVRSLRAEPSLIAWYVSDEPPPSQVEALAEARDTLHREDPDHPVWGVTDKPGITRMFARTMDVVGIDPYPIGNHSTRGKISICSEWVREAESNLWGMAAWHVPQVFNWKRYRQNVPHPDHRFPTKEEFANMNYQLIAGGANGLIGYTYAGAVDGRYDKPDGWQRVCEVYAELRGRIDLFLSDPGPAVSSAPADVVARTWRTDSGAVKTLVVNKTRQAVRGEVRLADGSAVAYDLAPLGYEIFGK